MAAVLLQVPPAGCLWHSEGTDDGQGCIKTADGTRASADTYNAAKALLPNGCSLVSVLGNRRGMPYNAFFDNRRHFEVAFVQVSLVVNNIYVVYCCVQLSGAALVLVVEVCRCSHFE
jgi:hypothetical protein